MRFKYIYTKMNKSKFWGEKSIGYISLGGETQHTCICPVSHIIGGGGSPSSFSTLRLFCLIRDHPNVQELWGRGDHLRGSEAIFSVSWTRLIRFLHISSGVLHFRWITAKDIYLWCQKAISNKYIMNQSYKSNSKENI